MGEAIWLKIAQKGNFFRVYGVLVGHNSGACADARWVFTRFRVVYLGVLLEKRKVQKAKVSF